MIDMLLREPVATAAAIRAVLIAAVSFGAQLEPEQIGGIVLVVEAILALITRSAVAAPTTVATIANQAATRVAQEPGAPPGPERVRSIVGDTLAGVGGVIARVPVR